MNKSWIVVADRTVTRIFERVGRRDELRLKQQFDHPEGRLKTGELMADKGGRADSSTRAGGHALSTETSPREHELSRYIDSVADHLNRSYHCGEYQQLCIIAPPHVLGLMRSKLQPVVTRSVTDEIPKDLSELSDKQILEYL